MHNSSFQIRANSLFRMVPVVLGTSTSWIAIHSDCIHLSEIHDYQLVLYSYPHSWLDTTYLSSLPIENSISMLHLLLWLLLSKAAILLSCEGEQKY